MTTADLLGGATLAALVLYALLGGADFGGGVLDLVSSGPRRDAQRALVERALGPIWEANHVWLVLVVVVLFSGFPAAFSAISVGLFVPLVLLLAGIVLRGAAFTFRAYDRPDPAVRVRWGLVFSVSSVLAPVMLGVVVGALASGRVAADGSAPFAWLAPFPLAVGVLALALFAFLAAAYAAVEAHDAGEAQSTGEVRRDPGLAAEFGVRAIAAGVAVFVLAALAGALSFRDAPRVFAGLTSRPWSLALHAATAVAALSAFAALLRHRFRLARLAAAVQASLIVLGWGASQHPYLVAPGPGGPGVTLASASAPRATQVALLWALAAGAAVLFHALYLLFRTFKGERPFAVVERPPRG